MEREEVRRVAAVAVKTARFQADLARQIEERKARRETQRAERQRELAEVQKRAEVRAREFRV